MRSRLLALALLAAPAALAQPWEAGAGVSTVFLTSGDRIVPHAEVFLRRTLSPHLSASVRVGRTHTAENRREAFTKRSEWFDRRRTSLEVGLHARPYRRGPFALYVAGGLSHVERRELDAHSFWGPPAGSVTHQRVLAECRAIPSCVSRVETWTEGDYVSTAQLETAPQTGGFVEAEPTWHLGPVRASLPVGGRYYGGPDRDLTWHAGVRVGVPF